MAHPHDRIIKVGQLRGAVRVLRETADDLIVKRDALRAWQDGQALLEAARADAERIREAARQDGIAQGLRQAMGILAQVEAQRDDLLRRSEQDVVTLALATARKLLRRAIEIEPERMLDLVERALAEVGAARRITVRVAPQVGPSVTEAQARLEAENEAPVSIELDESLQLGDCIIETDAGRIDARLDVQFETILRSLLPESAEG